MTDKKDPKVRAIRKDIKIVDEEAKPEPIPQLVSLLEVLLEDAKSGRMRELCFVSINEDETCKRGVQGEPYNFTLMQCSLDVLRTDYFEMATYPFLTGYYEDYE